MQLYLIVILKNNKNNNICKYIRIVFKFNINNISKNKKIQEIGKVVPFVKKD